MAEAKKYNKFSNHAARKFHFPKHKKNFFEKI